MATPCSCRSSSSPASWKSPSTASTWPTHSDAMPGSPRRPVTPVAELLLGPEHATAADELGWSRSRFLRKATGREPLDEVEAAQVERLGIRWLALG